LSFGFVAFHTVRSMRRDLCDVETLVLANVVFAPRD
jgi:hypothetical protein